LIENERENVGEERRRNNEGGEMGQERDGKRKRKGRGETNAEREREQKSLT